jgi:hypothetical protein
MNGVPANENQEVWLIQKPMEVEGDIATFSIMETLSYQ